MILDGEQVSSPVTSLHAVITYMQVLEGVSRTFVKYPGEEHAAWLQRLTHLHCQNQVSARCHAPM